MTLDQLKALQAIVEGGSLRAAAETLHRTQPTISVSIKNLEEELNVEIFDRDQYRNRLTPEGETLYEKAKLVLKQAKSFESLAKQLAIGEEAELGIAFDPVIPIHQILGVVRQCKSEFPRTRLHIYSENSQGSLELMKGGKAAIIVVGLSCLKSVEKLESFSYLDLPIISVIAAQSYKFLEYEVIPSEVMKKYSQVVISNSSPQNPSTENYGVLEDGDQWKVNDYHTKKEIILQGMGWGGLPEHLIRDELDQGLLIPISVEGSFSVAEAPIHVARLTNEPAGPVSKRLWQLFQESVS